MIKKYLRLLKEPLTSLSNLPDLLLTVDKDWIVTYTNRAETNGNIIGENVLDFVGTDFTDQYKEHLTAAFNEISQEFEMPGNEDNLQAIWYNVGMFAIKAEENVESVLIISTNITDRKKTEEKIKKSEQMLSQAERIAKIGSWEMILETGEMSWSMGMYDIYNIDPKTFTPCEAFKIYLLLSNDTGAVGNWIAKAISGIRQGPLEFGINAANGTVRHIRGEYEIVFNEEGKPIKLIGIDQDITERKKSEVALSESTNLIQGIYEASPDAVIFIDEDEIITKWDNKSEALFGWTENEITGMQLSEAIIPVRYLKKLRNRIKHYSKNYGGSVAAEIINIRALNKNGVEFEISLSIISAPVNGKVQFIVFVRDISERKKAEEKIKANEERYRGLFERNLAGVYRANTNNIILECNDAFANIIGFNSADEVIGKHSRDLYDNLSHSNFIEVVNGHNNKVKGYESLIQTKSGALVYLLENAFLLADEKGENKLMEGTLIDITERKEAEKALLKSQERYKNLLDNMNDGFVVDDISGKVTFANERFFEIFGADKTNAGDSVMEDYIAPEYREMYRDRLNRRVANIQTPDTYEFEGLRNDGTRIWLEVNVSAIIENGITIATQSLLRDITEKKIKDIEFKKLTELKRKIIESSDALFYVIEIKDVRSFTNPLVYVSGNAEEFYGFSEEYIIENPEIWYNAIHPDDINLVKESTYNLFCSKKPVSRIYRIKNSSTREYIWVHDFVKPSLNSLGEVNELYGSVKNITELKNKETTLEKTDNELRDRYNELMQFNYIVSHNLRAPIANVIGLINVMNLPNVSAEEKPMIIEHIQTAVLKMDELVKDLNTILSTRSTLNTKKSTVSIRSLILSISDTLEKQIHESRTIIKTDISNDTKELFTIKSYLESVIYNLISNAIKYNVPSRTPEICISTKNVDDKLIIKVSDNGRGINLTRYGNDIFGLYKRFHLDTEGKGLGLHMSKTQIEALGGKISVESEIDKGTTFTITLPIQ